MPPLPQLAVLASGFGSNLQVILDGVAQGEIPGEVKLVLSDQGKAHALERARKASVEAVVLSPQRFSSREEYDQNLVNVLRDHQIDWVVLAGFMRILSPVFLAEFSGKVVNIHPALLPKYPGTHAIERAFEAGDQEVGVTVHFVDEGVDTGPIIMQEGFEVEPNETLDQLTERVHTLEHRIYPKAINKVLKGEVSMTGEPR